MSRITETFKALKAEKRKALVIFLTVGDPGINVSESLVKAAFDSGADIVELGVPFSDPLADGPVIQESFLRAIRKGVNVEKAMRLVNNLRSSGIDKPLVFMLASNLVINHGVSRFMTQSAQNGVDGVILPDVPPEEADEFLPSARKAGLDTIFLAAPTSTGKRLRQIASISSGFLYYINIAGVTGKKKAAPRDVTAGIKKIKRVTKLSVCAGFGVTEPKQARDVARHADGVVIGSQAIRVINNAKNQGAAVKDLAKFVRSIRKGMDGK